MPYNTHNEGQVKLICVCQIAAGMRANPDTMRAAEAAAERDTMDVQYVIAMWATTQFEFIKSQLEK